MRRRDRKRLQNWLLFCLLAAAAVVCIFGRVRQMAQRRQEQEQQLENGQAILTDAADAALVEERSLENWLPDVLVSEISPAFGSEVWKAQSVLARTWLLNTAVEAGRAATVTDVQKDMRLSLKELRGAGWSGDGQEWAEADTGVRRLCKSSISATGGGILVQESAEVGRMFPPLFHLCSAGRTRDGGTRYPGLCSVKSTTDLLVTEAVQVQFFTTEQFRTRITEVLGETIAAEEAQADRLSYEKDISGYVTELLWKRGDRAEQNIDIAVFQKQFALPSPWFEIADVDGQIRITCRGIGHGYGMSQYGAAAMEQQGRTWREMLAWYFPNAKLTQK